MLTLECSSECAQGHTVCHVEGEIDVATADEMRRVALAVMDEHGPSLTLDLSEVSFMDCAGLTALLSVRRVARARGGHVSLTGLSDMILRLLHITGLKPEFGLEESTP